MTKTLCKKELVNKALETIKRANLRALTEQKEERGLAVWRRAVECQLIVW